MNAALTDWTAHIQRAFGLPIRSVGAVVCLSVVVILGSPQAQASGLGTGLAFANPCLKDTDLDTLQRSLEEQGWQASAEASDALIHGLAWIGVSQYFVGDSGGERVGSILELKIKSASGQLRKMDIPQSKNRYLARSSGEATEILHLMWRQPTPKIIEVECRAALGAASLSEIRGQIDEMDLPAFTALRTAKTADGSLNITLVRADRLPGMTPPDGIVSTYRRLKAE